MRSRLSVLPYCGRKRPDIERPYKAFGYPVLPAIYILLALTFCVFLIIMKPVYAGAGLGIVLVGIPLYYIAVSNKKKAGLSARKPTGRRKGY